MYEGSMRGKGSPFFATWGYVISHMVPSGANGMVVDLNPEVVGFFIGESPKVISEKIDEMCQVDLKSRTKDEDGRKLVKLTEYSYRVVNGVLYRQKLSEDERREYQRVKQAEYREKKKIKGGQPDGGAAAVARAEDHEQDPVAAAEHEALYRQVEEP
jgi:hypothetical protein